ncbi:hypothetical protein [Cognatishimia maritima]|uniref:Uncharacterized protein n=1 Tax=Cognatishimia maritima TaxID=870908 RepID=A0A1M5NZX6_9RHOB|nr:hypothetical protein [Cognatishimia maritima]SHG95072.1 hypothetical protein SAMN04488044_1676 [Cognatishimia maritima]
MASSRKSKSVVATLLACLTLAGCSAEYMNNWDRISTRSGNANQANTAIMEVEPTNTGDVSTNVGG